MDTVRDFRVGVDPLVSGDGPRVNTTMTLRTDVDLDGKTDTVLTLTNSATLVLLGVAGAQDWTVAGTNVLTLPPLDLFA